MVVCQSQTSLVKSVESSSENGESDCDTVCSENNENMATQSCHYNNLAADGADGDANGEDIAHFGSISVCNSTDIHFGNKTFYNGPITIKQFVYTPEQGTSGAASSFKGETVNISQIFRNFNTPEASELTLENPSRVFYQASDLKTSNGGQSSNSLTPQENSKSTNGSQKKYFICSCPSLRLFVTVLLVAVLIIVLTVLVLNYEKKANRVVPHYYENPALDLPVSVVSPEANFTLSGKLRLIPRRDWLAQPAAVRADKLVTPVPYVIISHTATEQCEKIAECVLIVRLVQSFHIDSRGWADIGYNFLVGGDGFAYTGRGWDSIGAHSFGYNNKSIGISFMGTFTSILPPPRQLLAAKQLIELGVQLGKIAEDYKLLAHRQVSATESPGAMLYQELQKWPHWAPEP